MISAVLSPNNSNAAVARMWAAAGFPVFPCHPETKRPMVKGWRNSTDSASWLGRWVNGSDWMPGLDCSSASLVIVDCDYRPDRDGETNFRDLCNFLGIDLANVPSVTTPSGGCHFYFKQPRGEKIKNSAGEIGIGVDVRGDGGFVIVAGARRADGKEYVPDHGEEVVAIIDAVATGNLPEFPQELLRHLARPQKVVPFSRGNSAEQAVSMHPDDALWANIQMPWNLGQASLRVAAASEGKRNDTLNREAFIAGLRILAGKVDPSHARQLLAKAASQAGLDDTEITETIEAAFRRAAASVGRPASSPSTEQRSHYGILWERSGNGSLKRSYQNAMLAVRALGIEPARDAFSDKLFLKNALGSRTIPEDHVGPLSDNAMALLRKKVQDTFGFDPGKDFLMDAVKALAEEARYNPVWDWLDGLRWDRTPRLRDWLPRVTGAPDTSLFRTAGILLCLAMVARARFPGTKFDVCIVLEGVQGCGKSTFIRELASGPGEGYMVDAPGLIAMDNKTRAELLAGKWIVELAELSGMARSETEGVKAFLTQNSDHYRPPYGTTTVDRPRTCVFIATTNAITYLPDATGNRRFLPVPCSRVNIPLLRTDRDQLLAEADAVLRRMMRDAVKAGRVRQGQSLPQDLADKLALPKRHWSEAAGLSDQRRIIDPVEEALPVIVLQLEQSSPHQLPGGGKFIASADLLSRLRLELGRTVRNNGLAGWMQSLGWKAQKYRPAGGIQMRGYIKTVRQ